MAVPAELVLVVALLALLACGPLGVSGQSTAQPRPLDEGWQLRVGWQHSCVFRARGDLVCWGKTQFGQTGVLNSQGYVDPATQGCRLEQVDLGTDARIREVVLGGASTCVVFDMAGNNVKCFGSNRNFELGLDDDSYHHGVPGRMGANLTFLDFGHPDLNAVQMSPGRNNRCVVFGGYANFVTCFGSNSRGKLGLETGKSSMRLSEAMLLPGVTLGAQTQTVELLSCKRDHCAVIFKENGNVKLWGANRYGELGTGDSADRGNRDNMGNSLPFLDLGDDFLRTVDVCGGAHHTCVLQADEGRATVKTKCFGSNNPNRDDAGLLGIGTNGDIGEKPEHVGEDSGPFVDVDLGADFKPVKLDCGSGFTCALGELDGSPDLAVKCWGINAHGQLGQGDSQVRGQTPQQMGANLLPVRLPKAFRAVDVSVGETFTCVMLERRADGKRALSCFGEANLGQTMTAGKTHGSTPETMGEGLRVTMLDKLLLRNGC